MGAAFHRIARIACAILAVTGSIACSGGGGGGPVFTPNFLASDVRVDTDPAGVADSVAIRVCVDGLNVYVVWSDDRNGETDIYFNRSTDGGATWLPADVRLDSGTAGAAASDDPRICCDGGTLHVVWEDARDGAKDIYYQRSADGGDTWLANDLRIDVDTAGSAESGDPEMACTDGYVYIVWEDERFGNRDVCFRGSLDGGVSFGAEVLVDSNGAGTSFSDRPRLAASGLNVYVVWKDDRNGNQDIYLNRSSNGGLGWQVADTRLDTDVAGAATSSDPEIDVDGMNVYVTWTDDRDGASDIRFNRSLDAGATWLAADLRLDTNGAGASDSTRPQVRSSGTYVHVVWVDYRSGSADIRHNVSADNGTTWRMSDHRLDTDPAGSAQSEFVQLAVQGRNVYAAWQDDRDGLNDIRFSYSTDYGNTFVAADLQSDTQPAGASNSVFPRLAADGLNVYILWSDERDGNQDVYVRPSVR